MLASRWRAAHIPKNELCLGSPRPAPFGHARFSLAPRFLAQIACRIGAHPVREDLLAAYYCVFDRNTPSQVKITLIAAIAYFVLRFDAIPDMLPVNGFIDAAAVLAAAVELAGHITPEHHEAASWKN